MNGPRRSSSPVRHAVAAVGPSTGGSLRAPWRLVRALALVGLAVWVVSCSSTGSSRGETTPPPGTPGVELLTPAEFAARVEQGPVVTINVHVPDEGSIPGTDLVIPFDQIADSDALPEDLSTPLAVYCRSGNMSADAVRDLQAMGYTDIVELEGGFNAWVETGRPLNPANA